MACAFVYAPELMSASTALWKLEMEDWSQAFSNIPLDMIFSPPTRFTPPLFTLEKASNITVVDVKAVGAFGRLTLAGREGDVEEAAAAAMRAVEAINRRARA